MAVLNKRERDSHSAGPSLCPLTCNTRPLSAPQRLWRSAGFFSPRVFAIFLGFAATSDNAARRIAPPPRAVWPSTRRVTSAAKCRPVSRLVDSSASRENWGRYGIHAGAWPGRGRLWSERSVSDPCDILARAIRLAGSFPRRVMSDQPPC
jgi:hypothetical protein